MSNTIKTAYETLDPSAPWPTKYDVGDLARSYLKAIELLEGVMAQFQLADRPAVAGYIRDSIKELKGE